MSLDMHAIKLQLKDSNFMQQRIEYCIRNGNTRPEDNTLQISPRDQCFSSSQSLEGHGFQSSNPTSVSSHYERLKEV
jgi:hypothetical protein